MQGAVLVELRLIPARHPAHKSEHSPVVGSNWTCLVRRSGQTDVCWRREAIRPRVDATKLLCRAS